MTTPPMNVGVRPSFSDGGARGPDRTLGRFKNLMRPEQPRAASPLQESEFTEPVASRSPIIIIFIVSLFIPIQFYFGDLRLSAYRIVLLLMFVPAFVLFLRNSGGAVTKVDFLIFGHALVGGLALLATGLNVPSFGIFVVEAAGPYLLARCFIRNGADFTRMVNWLTYCILATIPFALYENVTEQPIILKTLGTVFNVLKNVPHETRLGLDRAQVVFDHPILYGVFCSMGKSLAKVQLRYIRAGLVAMASFLSLSSGALVCVAFQIALSVYDRALAAMTKRWTILIGGCLVLYFLLEIASNRSVAQILIPYIALNEGTAWTRLLVNASVMEQIAQKPWFGFGLNGDWIRPHWVVTKSIDNFWLAVAFRHGVPTIALLGLAALALLVGLMRAKTASERDNRCRIGLAITIGALCLAITTVHLWNSTYCMFIFLFGTGVWLFDGSNKSPDFHRRRPSPKTEPEISSAA